MGKLTTTRVLATLRLETYSGRDHVVVTLEAARKASRFENFIAAVMRRILGKPVRVADTIPVLRVPVIMEYSKLTRDLHDGRLIRQAPEELEIITDPDTAASIHSWRSACENGECDA